MIIDHLSCDNDIKEVSDFRGRIAFIPNDLVGSVCVIKVGARW
jgi:hypothetical protein